MFRELLDFIVSVTYPQPCSICGNSVQKLADGTACTDCWQRTRIFTGNETLCAKCGAYLGASPGHNVGAICGRCSDHHYDRAIAVGIYEHALAASVIRLKSEPFLAKRVKEHFLAAFDACGLDDVSLIVPVPLSKKRFIERGFNQADVLGSLLAGEHRIRMPKQLLVRKLHTPMHRAAMDRKAREATVKNAFEAASRSGLKGAHVLVVDDVFTSGATVSACADVLKKAGADKVSVLTLARAR